MPGGAGTEDYAVASAALRYLAPSWRIKAEWIEGRDLRGVLGRDESIYYVHGGYNLSPTFELVARHYAGRSVLGSVSTTLGNTYIGITKYFHHSDTVRTRLQANYVLASGDRLDYQGVRGFRDDTILVQLQFYAEK
ncbi:MAG TPA: hypothetical protein VLD39_12055 [Gammaproteobacteria bacterium]|nr:hypothetical protein [Gammaproteobacteria bacterium]